MYRLRKNLISARLINTIFVCLLSTLPPLSYLAAFINFYKGLRVSWTFYGFINMKSSSSGNVYFQRWKFARIQTAPKFWSKWVVVSISNGVQHNFCFGFTKGTHIRPDPSCAFDLLVQKEFNEGMGEPEYQASKWKIRASSISWVGSGYVKITII